MRVFGFGGRVVLALLVVSAFAVGLTQPHRALSSALPPRVYLPLVGVSAGAVASATHRVNATHLAGDVGYGEVAIFWFGKVDYSENHANVRVGYSDEYLYVDVQVIDHFLWYDPEASSAAYSDWDSLELVLDLGGNHGTALTGTAYRFDKMLAGWEPNDSFRREYRGNGSTWTETAPTFTASSNWRGNGPNDDSGDEGWGASYRISFASLGLAGPPADGSVWGLGLVLHDRDSAAGPVSADQVWPTGLDRTSPRTWGQLSFGVPKPADLRGTVGGEETIRNGLNGVVVKDAAVGGTVGYLCPGGEDTVWREWGNQNFAGAERIVIQDQGDVADWRCFAKYFVTFPLDSLPPGKVILSASLTMLQFGNSDPTLAKPSYIQILTADREWDESTLTWNNAPLAAANYGGSWVDPLGPSGEPAQRTWDVTLPVAQAYADGQSVRLILFDSDWDYHSGKYFEASESTAAGWEGRPTLRVRWGEP